MKTDSESRVDRLLRALTRQAHRTPWWFLAMAAVVLAVSWGLATRLRVKGDFVLLLPSESPTAQRFRNALDRKGGSGSTLLVMAESPDEGANRKLVDQLESAFRGMPERLLSSAQKGPGEARDFFLSHRWLFASERDLHIVNCELRRERIRNVGLDLELDDSTCVDEIDELLGAGAPSGDEGAAALKISDDSPAGENKSRIALVRERLQREEAKHDQFPSGYFRSDDGRIYVLVLRSPTAGMGEFSADVLLDEVKQAVADANPRSFHPEMTVGYGGDIPNAIAQRQALIEDMTLVSVMAVLLVLGVIVLFFRSVSPLLHIGLSVGAGCGVAFASAYVAYGHLNAATSFLGSIIVGNGINDSIIYRGRYRERRSLGDSVGEALEEAAVSCRKGTWLASVAAGGAYAALMVTSFRGFSEFGLIGGVGMISCWLATFSFCPASLTVYERVRERVGGTRVQRAPKPVRNRLVLWLARGAQMHRGKVLLGTAVVVIVAAWPLPEYLQDPWEYDFGKLGSRSNAQSGAGQWSVKADRIFKSRGAPILMLADSMDQAPDLAAAVENRDEALSGGRFVDRTVTIYERLGGEPQEVEKKLAVLAEIRDELDRAHPRLRGEDREFATRWRPPEALVGPTPEKLPSLLLDQFRERDGTIGTPVYVYLNPHVSRSDGNNLLAISDVLESSRLPNGTVAPNASRATVFAEMIRSMERDGPLATLSALLVVVFVTVLVTRRFKAAVAVLGALLCGVTLTVGGAAYLGVRFNFLNFVALPLTFGIGVEYAVNLYDRIRVMGGDITEGMASAGGAGFLCSLTTMLGYGSLLFADNMALQSFAKYAVAGEVACILTGLLVLPAALSFFARRKKLAA